MAHSDQADTYIALLVKSTNAKHKIDHAIWPSQTKRTHPLPFSHNTALEMAASVIRAAHLLHGLTGDSEYRYEGHRRRRNVIGVGRTQSYPRTQETTEMVRKRRKRRENEET